MSQPADNLQLFQNAVQGIYRLFRVARIHDVNNDAVDDAIAAALEGLARLTEGTNGVLLLFARDTVLVNGQLLPMPPDVWETAMALQKFLAASNVNSLWLGIETDRHALRTLLRFFRQGSGMADPNAEAVVPDARGYLATGIRVRRVADALVVGIESPELSESERSLLTYALAVRGVRTLSEEFKSAPAGFSSYFKRVAWQLSRLPVSQLRHLIDVGTIDREDNPTRVVQAALIASLMARLLNADDREVSSILLAALQLDASDARDHLTVSFARKDAAIDAVVLQMYLNGLRGDSAGRAIIAFETRRLMDQLRRRIHRWGVPASLDSYILATARLFTDTFSRAAAGGVDSPVDAAIRALRSKADEPGWIAALELLSIALGTPGPGAAVQFANGDSGVVLRSGSSPGTAGHLVVQIMASRTSAGRTVDLADRVDAQQWGTPSRCDRPPAWEHPPPGEITEAHLAWVQWMATLRESPSRVVTENLAAESSSDTASVPPQTAFDNEHVPMAAPDLERIDPPTAFERLPAQPLADDEPPATSASVVEPPPAPASDRGPEHDLRLSMPDDEPGEAHHVAAPDSPPSAGRWGLDVMADAPLILRMDAERPVVPDVEMYDDEPTTDRTDGTDGTVLNEGPAEANEKQQPARRMPAPPPAPAGPAPEDFLQLMASLSRSSTPRPSAAEYDPHAPPVQSEPMSEFRREDTPAAIELLTGRVRRTAAPPADPEWLQSEGVSAGTSPKPADSSAAGMLAAGVNRRRKRSTTGGHSRITGSGS